MITTKDVVAAAGVVGNASKALLTKAGCLKKDIGNAHKGWFIICMKGTDQDVHSNAVSEAMECITKMYDEADKNILSFEFLFGRRTLVVSIEIWLFD